MRARAAPIPASGWAAPAAIAAALLAWGTSNPGLTFAMLAALIAYVFVLWRPFEPPVLLIAAGLQWLQVAVKVFDADARGITLEAYFGGSEIVTATWLSLAGLCVFVLGLWLATRGFRGYQPERVVREIELLSLRRTFTIYLVLSVFSSAVDTLAWVVPQLTQILLVVADLKWVAFFLLALAVVVQRRGVALVVAATGLEVAVGVLGYFSGFKQPFIVLAAVLLTVRRRLDARQLVYGVAVLSTVVAMAIAWLAVREDYRSFLNRGQGQQVALRSVEERVGKLAELLANVDGDAIAEGTQALVERIAYVDFFAHTVRRIPKMFPYQDGALWWSAVRHVLTPRLLFPDKPTLESDSVITRKFAGVDVAGGDRGTSVGIGYLAESYVDFGPAWMMAPIFVLGIAVGTMYRTLISQSPVKAVGLAAASSIVLTTCVRIEINSLKLVGGLLMGYIVMMLLVRFGLARLFPLFAPRVRRAVPRR